jgi:hypothetical protein
VICARNAKNLTRDSTDDTDPDISDIRVIRGKPSYVAVPNQEIED